MSEQHKPTKPPTKPVSNSKKLIPLPLKVYLIIYNILSTFGWLHIFSVIVIHLFDLDGKSNNFLGQSSKASTKLPGALQEMFPPFLRPTYGRLTSTFSRVGAETAVVQSLATLEILHVLLGWVKTPLPTTLAQVSSRLFLVWGISNQFSGVHVNPLYATMVLAWSITEVIRYAFYATNLLGYNIKSLLYLRYTTFYVLYPMGAASEAFLIYATIPSSSPIPGWKPRFQTMWKPTDYVRAIFFIVWWPGLYFMYSYMIIQRQKVLPTRPIPVTTVQKVD